MWHISISAEMCIAKNEAMFSILGHVLTSKILLRILTPFFLLSISGKSMSNEAWVMKKNGPLILCANDRTRIIFWNIVTMMILITCFPQYFHQIGITEISNEAQGLYLLAKTAGHRPWPATTPSSPAGYAVLWWFLLFAKCYNKAVLSQPI